jgi:helix-turn-helix protein
VSVKTDDVQCKTASATNLPAEEDLEKQQRKQRREKFLEKIRGSLGSRVHQLAFSPTEAALACGKSPTWAYRQIWAGKLRVLNAEQGRLMIPRSEIEHFLSGAEKYTPEPKHAKKNGGEHSLGSL